MPAPSEVHRAVIVDVYSDVACPWCFVGKRRLERVLAEEPAGSVRVAWRPFELQPGLPGEGVDANEFFAAKFGGRERMLQVFSHVAEIGRREGIDFRFDLMRRAPNTRLAHQVAFLAAQRGQQESAVETLFRGHFEEGSDVGDLDDVLELFARHGLRLEEDELREAVRRGEGRAEVEAELQKASRMGVSSVPLFVANNAYAIAGAQPPEYFKRLLAAARDNRGT